MYKKLGLSSEEVCEIGKWQNSQAFSAHYLRLGASRVAAARLHDLLHTVSPEGSAEPEWSRTPENQTGELEGKEGAKHKPKVSPPNPPRLCFA